MGGIGSSSKRKASKKKSNKSSSQRRKKNRRKESKKRSRDYDSVSSYSDDDFSDSDTTSSPASESHSKRRKNKSKKIRRRDRFVSSESDTHSIGSESDSLFKYKNKNKKKRSKIHSKSKKRKGRDRSASPDRKRKRLTIDRRKKLKPSRKHSSSSDSPSCSTCPSSGSGDEDDHRRSKTKSNKETERPRGRALVKVHKKRKYRSPSCSSCSKDSYEVREKRKVRSPSCSSCSRGSERTPGVVQSEVASVPVNNSRRLKSVIAIAYQPLNEGENRWERDLNEEAIVYDLDDYRAPRSPDMNASGRKREFDSYSHDASNKKIHEEVTEGRDAVIDGSDKKIVGDNMLDGAHTNNHEGGRKTDVSAPDGDDLESILRRQALENLRKFKGGVQTGPRDNANLKTSEETDVGGLYSGNADISQNKSPAHDRSNNQEMSGPMVRGDFSRSTVPDDEKESEIAKEAVIHPPVRSEDEKSTSPRSVTATNSLSKSDGRPDQEATNACSSSVTEPLPDDSSMPGEHNAEEHQHEAKDGFEQKTMSVMRGGEMVQVSYKVYIPKRAPALARRPLKRVPEPEFESWLRDSGYLEILDQRTTNLHRVSAANTRPSDVPTAVVPTTTSLSSYVLIFFSRLFSSVWTLLSLLTFNPFSKLAADDFSGETLPWTSAFFGTSDSYSFPANPAQARLRVHENVKRYARNYTSLLALLFACSLSLWDMFKLGSDRWGLERYNITREILVRIAKCVTAVVLFISNVKLAILCTCAISYTFMILHASFRKLTPSKQPVLKRGLRRAWRR